MEKFEIAKYVDEMNFFSIYEVEGKKYFQINAYVYEVDEEEERWAISEVENGYELLTDFVKKYRDYEGDCNDYVTDIICDCLQFENDASVGAMVRVINQFISGKEVYKLDFKDITEDTPCGFYMNYGTHTW